MTLSINGHEVIPGAEWVTRGGKIAKIFALNSGRDLIVGSINDYAINWRLNGSFYAGVAESENDLIRPVAAPAEKYELPQAKDPDATLYSATFSDNQVNGVVRGDKKGRFKDGDYIHTSDIQKITVHTLNSVYDVHLEAAPEKRKVQIAEFWTVHGSIDGTAIAAFMHKPAAPNHIIIHHPAREVEVDV